MVNYISEYPDEGISMRKVTANKNKAKTPYLSIAEYLRVVGFNGGDTILLSWSKKQEKIVLQRFKGFNKDIANIKI